MPSPGIRNNNYLNVKNGPSPWLDAGNKDSRTDSRGHAVFKDPVYGIRAGILLLKTYYFTHNRRTIAEVLSRWAPASDTIGSLPGTPANSPREYSAFVAGRMGIGYNDHLAIFDTDKTLGNIGQLRDLFFAMAAYEIGGGFKVPASEFKAALEIIEPGVTRNGSDDQATNEVLAAVKPTWSIGGSVGDRSKGAQNAEADVKAVQAMLLQITGILRAPACDPLGNDGKIAKDAAKSGTVKAIKAFQRRFLTRPDGLVEVDGKTWREMLRVIETGDLGDAPEPSPAKPGSFFFPFAKLPAKNWTSAPRSFASSRDKGKRAHAGCDLYLPAGTLIHAITDGTVVSGPDYFYSGTYALEVDHGTFIARYGEIDADAFVRKGDQVVAGQRIAKVGHLVGITVPSDMLHLEIYEKKASGRLTVGASAGKKTSAGIPFMRRKDLVDPTPLLDKWRHNLPGSPPLAAVRSRSAGKRAIPPQGFCIHLKRLREEKRSDKSFSRTVGEYRCYWNGIPITGLQGQIVERGGPGDNTTAIGDNRDRRIQAGLYPLAIQDGTNYKTHGYSAGKTIPKPGLLLQKTHERTAILLHPGEDYLSSIGCLNPASGLVDAKSKIDFADSRRQVIAIIDAIKGALGARLPRNGSIPGAVILIDGEPK